MTAVTATHDTRPAGDDAPPLEPRTADSRVAAAAADRAAALPQVNALPARQETLTGLAYWRHVASARHGVAAALALPLLYWIYASALGQLIPGDPVTLAALVVASILGALIVASYVRPSVPVTTTSSASPCAAGAVMPVILAMLLFQAAATEPLIGVLAAGVVGLGLVQRVSGTAACAA